MGSGSYIGFCLLYSAACLWDEKPTKSKSVYPTEPKKAEQAVEVPGTFLDRRFGCSARQLGDLVLSTSRRWEVYLQVTLNQSSDGVDVLKENEEEVT